MVFKILFSIIISPKTPNLVFGHLELSGGLKFNRIGGCHGINDSHTVAQESYSCTRKLQWREKVTSAGLKTHFDTACLPSYREV